MHNELFSTVYSVPGVAFLVWVFGFRFVENCNRQNICYFHHKNEFQNLLYIK
jgi:hypothetical protein